MTLTRGRVTGLFNGLLLLCAAGTTADAQSTRTDLMTPMNHGPFASSTISADPLSTRAIFVYKGIAVKVGPDAGGVMTFDTDLLRMAGAWTGGFLKWYPARDALEQWPGPDGFMHFTTGQRPGWSRKPTFSDPRPRPYGPASALGKYHGLYLHGERVVFSYSIGPTEIRETPGFEYLQERPVFTRTFNLAASQEPLSLHVLQASDGPATTLDGAEPQGPAGRLAIRAGGATRVIGFRGLPSGARWRLAHHHLILDLPASEQPLRFELALGPVDHSGDGRYIELYLNRREPVADLTPLQQPGPARWGTLETTLRRGESPGPFVVDELTLPAENPWRSFLRPSAIDFLSDDRAVLTSLSGDVWLVDGIAGDRPTLRWQRFATGLNQPLGVRVVDGTIYVTGRDQITRLHDRNGDGEADFYENFNNEVMAATNFHAFTLNLDTDSKGNFYFAKATPWPPAPQGVNAEITPHHGALFRLPPDGSKLEVIATGLRNPNGLSIGPDDEIVYADNEGNWVPTSKVHRIKADAFHGFIPSAHQEPLPADFEKPILWIPHFVDNSPSAPLFITSRQWPAALQGQLLLTSYGRGTLSLVLKEEVGEQWQGTHLTLPLEFESGIIHGRFHRDGHLYIAGLTSWQSTGHGGKWGSLHRVRYTGRPLHLPVAVSTRPDGLELRFAEELDPALARDVASFQITQWTYPWTSQYGTRGKVYSVQRPGDVGADPVVITSARLGADRKSVFLELPQLARDFSRSALPPIESLPDSTPAPLGLVLAIDYRLQSADGAELKHVLHKTIHRIPGLSPPTPAATTSRATAAPMPLSTVHAGHAGGSPGRSVTADGSRVVELRSTGVHLSYDVTEIQAKAGERLTLRYINASEMVHNLVVVRSEADIHPVGLAAITAHATDFVPESQRARILAHSKLAAPGDTVVVEFTVPPPGVYPYICTYSGHFTVMQGRIISKE